MSDVTSAIVRQAGDVLARLRTRRPRVHCLTNTVVQKLTADGLSALGAVPSMTDSPDEIEAFAGYADALLINLGTLNEGLRHVVDAGAQVTAASGKPIVLDPVFCNVSPVRLAFARDLIARYRPLLRANAAEIAALGPVADVAVVETGAIDRVAVSGRTLAIRNGHPWLAVVVGTGCLSGAMIAACRAVEPDALVAAGTALMVLGIAAEQAAERSAGPGTFGPALLDALFSIDGETLAAHARVNA